VHGGATPLETRTEHVLGAAASDGRKEAAIVAILRATADLLER
jgi:hypothetical protein